MEVFPLDAAAGVVDIVFAPLRLVYFLRWTKSLNSLARGKWHICCALFFLSLPLSADELHLSRKTRRNSAGTRDILRILGLTVDNDDGGDNV